MHAYVKWLQRTFGRKSDSSTSKLDVSVGLLTSGVNGGSVSLKCCQSKPLKNGCFMKSSMPFWPRRFSGVAIRRHIMALASSDTSSISSGNFNCAWNEIKIQNKWWQVDDIVPRQVFVLVSFSLVSFSLIIFSISDLICRLLNCLTSHRFIVQWTDCNWFGFARCDQRPLRKLNQLIPIIFIYKAYRHFTSYETQEIFWEIFDDYQTVQ